MHCPSCGFNDDDEWDEIRAEVARLTDENRKMNATLASDAMEILRLQSELKIYREYAAKMGEIFPVNG